MNDVLLTVSGFIPSDLDKQTEHGERPLADYAAMARAFPADLLDYAAAQAQTGALGRLLRALGGPNLMLAWACFRRRGRYRVIFTDGEQVGLPLALLFKLFAPRARPRHLMIGHLLSVGKKMLLLDGLGLHRQIDVFFVYSSWQKRFIEARWGVPPERVVLTPFMVDAGFFDPAQPAPAALGLPETPLPLLCAVGLEFRDYATLVEAVRGLDAKVVVTAASLWSRRSATRMGEALPENMVVRRLTYRELRQLYARSRFLVMPLQPVNFQAGVTAILEAMAMGKPVICSRTPGQTDVIVEGETGAYVPPGDAAALRAAIQRWLDNPAEVEAMGRRARQQVLEHLSLERYVARLAPYVRQAAEEPTPA